MNEDVFDSYELIEEALGQLADQSLSPRAPEGLYDYVAELALSKGSQALDIGCDDGWHAFELSERFGFRVTGVDPAGAAIERARKAAEARGVDVRFEIGRVEAIPAPDEFFDLVWCRDTLELIDDLDTTFREIRRVMKPGGRALIYTMCVTDWLAPDEVQRVVTNLGAHVESMQVDNLERAIAAAGFAIEKCDELGSEWGEYAEERAKFVSQRLIRAARLIRQPDKYIEKYGRYNYDTAVADYLWHVYRMIGKLSSRVLVLSHLPD